MNGVQDQPPTWKEWLVIVPAAVVLVIGSLTVIALIADGIGANVEQKERCLKQATNGYEIQRCR